VSDDDDPDWNLGTLRRTCRAVSELLHHLGHDPRVLAAFDTWCAERSISQDRFRRAWAGNQVDGDDLIRAARLRRNEARAALERVTRDELHLPYPWAPSVLLRTFQIWVENGVHRQRRRIPSLLPDAVSEATLPRGRGLRQTFKRDVEWFYRVRVKGEAPTDILRTVKKADPTLTSGASLVTQAVDRVHTWLDHPITFAWDREP
jgi:hypothetical protein